jgi:DNA-binding transcriptional LysR family regulator
MPRGTTPFEHMRELFNAHGLGLPNVMVETRSIVVLKGLVTRADFLGWMPQPMYDAESKAHMFDALPIDGLEARRRLTAFRRRQGILPAPAVKLVDELRRIAEQVRG